MLTATAKIVNTDSIEQLGSRVRYARKRNGLTLKELGDKVGCSESLLSKIERNHIVPSLPVLWRIAECPRHHLRRLVQRQELGTRNHLQ